MPLPPDQVEIHKTLCHRASLAHRTAVEADKIRILATKRTGVDFVALEERGDGIGQGVKMVLHVPTPPQRPRHQRTGRQAQRGPRGSLDWARPCRSSECP